MKDSMEKICKKCASDPMSHSFKKLSDKNGVITYYSQPSHAKLYDDKEGTLLHVDNALTLLGNRKWRCVMNGDGFEIKHAIQITTGGELLKMILEKYGTNLEQVIVINPSWQMKSIIKLLPSMVSEEGLKKLNVMDDRMRSVLEFV